MAKYVSVQQGLPSSVPSRRHLRKAQLHDTAVLKQKGAAGKMFPTTLESEPVG
jgi:hypothetical protein